MVLWYLLISFREVHDIQDETKHHILEVNLQDTRVALILLAYYISETSKNLSWAKSNLELQQHSTVQFCQSNLLTQLYLLDQASYEQYQQPEKSDLETNL